VEQRTVRELGGELWAELEMLSRESNGLAFGMDWQHQHQLVDFAMSVIARHCGKVIVNDEGLEVVPLPFRFPPEQID
jgi:hypothetical protein